MYRRLGKTIPEIKLPAGSEITTTVGGKKVSVAAPRITFVGGQQLTSTGTAEKVGGTPKVYPPGAPNSSTTPTQGGGVGVANEEGDGAGGGEGEGAGEVKQEETQEVEPVGM